MTSAAPVFLSGFCAPESRKFVLVAAILASSMGFIDGSVVAIAMPAIRTTLDASLAQAQWVHNAYMLTLSSLILAGGAMGDRFGLARTFSGGIMLFVAASLVCAIAPTSSFLIGARLVQGIGAAVMVPGSLAIIARAYPRKERGRAIGIWAAASAMTTALGPIIGGLALSIGGPEMWRWIFAVNLVLGALALYLLFGKVLADISQPDTPVDLAGAALATTSLFALAWGLTASQQTEFWLTLATIVFAMFLWAEHRNAHPMMPLSMFRNRVFSVANLLSFTLYSALNIAFFYMPMTLIAGWGLNEITASAAFAPMSIFMFAFSARMGRLADRFGTAPLLSLGSVCVGVGYGVIALVVPHQLFLQGILPAMCLVGLGMSMIVAPLSAAIMGAVDETQSGIASAINNAVARIAGLVSVAAIGGVITSSYLAAGGTESFGIESDAVGHAPAMSAAFATAAWVAAGLAAISAIAALGSRKN
ncbi:MAG: MFS transporter [Rhodobacteraceae bacterium]|nr:MFS transporter [Paracoccaceae bacterium]